MSEWINREVRFTEGGWRSDYWLAVPDKELRDWLRYGLLWRMAGLMEYGNYRPVLSTMA